MVMLHQTLPVVQVAEWQSATLDGVCLTPVDRALVERLRSGSGGRLIIDELNDGVRISARSWVGTVRLAGFEVRVLPKLAGYNVGLLRLLEYVGDFGLLRRTTGKGAKINEVCFFDLMAAFFADACARLLRGGLFTDYVEHEAGLPVLRGRILADRQICRRFGLLDKLECRYEERETDILENKVLAVTLGLVAGKVNDEGVRRQLRRLYQVFRDACSTDHLPAGSAVAEIRKRIIYHRLNEHYREAHQLAWLLLDGLGVDNLNEEGRIHCFVFLLDMNRLFELFVTRWVGELGRDEGWRIQKQTGVRSVIWDVGAKREYAGVIPDVLIGSYGSGIRRVPLDAKYKLYDWRKIDSGDMYQLFFYALSLRYDADTSPAGSPMAILTYPSERGDGRVLELEARDRAGMPVGGLKVFGVHIPTVLSEAAKGYEGLFSARLKKLVSPLVAGRPVAN